MSDRGTRTKLSLYYYDQCPFCQRVLRAINGLDVEVELRNVLTTPSWREELIQARGRGTVPVLKTDYAQGPSAWMPESADIIEHLNALSAA